MFLFQKSKTDTAKSAQDQEEEELRSCSLPGIRALEARWNVKQAVSVGLRVGF